MLQLAANEKSGGIFTVTYKDLISDSWMSPTNEYEMFGKLVKPYRRKELEVFRLSLFHNIFPDENGVAIDDFFEASINTGWNRKSLKKVATFLWRNPDYLFYYISNSSYLIYLEMLGIQVMDQKTAFPAKEDERKEIVLIGKLHLAVFIIILEELRKLGLQLSDFPISSTVYFSDCRVSSCSTPCRDTMHRLNTVFEVNDNYVLQKMKFSNLLGFLEAILGIVKEKNDYSLSDQRDRMIEPVSLDMEENDFMCGDTEEILLRFIHSLVNELPFFTEELVASGENEVKIDAHTRIEENFEGMETVSDDSLTKGNVSSLTNFRDKIKTGKFRSNLKSLAGSMVTRFLDGNRLKRIESSSSSDDNSLLPLVPSGEYCYYHSIYDQESCGFTDKPFVVEKYYALFNGQCVASFKNEEEVQNYILSSDHMADCLVWKAEIQIIDHPTSSDAQVSRAPMTYFIDYYPKKNFMLTHKRQNK